MQDTEKEMIENYTEKHSRICNEKNLIDSSLYGFYGVKRGLRDISGKGVLTGITNISLIQSHEENAGKSVPCDGKLFYRGYNIIDI